VLVYLSILATMLVGFGQGPWWFWLLGTGAVALLMLTDHDHLHPRLDGAVTFHVPVLGGLVNLTAGCLACAGAFAIGRMMSWALPA
jgi:hypothetical protein